MFNRKLNPTFQSKIFGERREKSLRIFTDHNFSTNTDFYTRKKTDCKSNSKKIFPLNGNGQKMLNDPDYCPNCANDYLT